MPDPCLEQRNALDSALTELNTILETVDARLTALQNCLDDNGLLASEMSSAQSAVAALIAAFNNLGQGGPGGV